LPILLGAGEDSISGFDEVEDDDEDDEL